MTALPPSLRPLTTRRQVLSALSALGFGGVVACGEQPLEDLDDDDDDTWLDDIDWEIDPVVAHETVEALMDVFIPAEFAPNGDLESPGAVQAGAMSVLELQHFVPVARAQGLLPPGLPDWLEEAASSVDPILVTVLASELEAMAQDQVPGTPFRNLTRSHQEEAVARAMVDPSRRPVMRLARGVAFIAYLGALTSDVGLVECGFPPFESFSDKRAVSGYPRTRGGRLIDPDLEDLDAIAEDGQLDDYTYNAEPEPTPGDDLSDVIDLNGDLY